jgi:WD40 repeat protein
MTNTYLKQIYTCLVLLILSGVLYPAVSSGQGGPTIVRDIAYSPDGLYIAYSVETPACYGDSPSPFLVQIVDAGTGQLVQTVGKDDDCPYNAVSWSPDGTRLALSSQAGTASVWNVNTGTQVSLYANSGYGVRSLHNVAWNPTNDRLLVGEPSINIWNAQTGDRIGSVVMTPGIPSLAWSAAWSPDGNNVALSTRGDKIEIWDISATTTIPAQWPLIRSFDTGPVSKIDYSPDGQLIAGVSTTEIRVFDVATGLLTKTLVGATNTITDVGWSPNGLHIAASDLNGIVHVWEYTTRVEVATFSSFAPVRTLDWHPSGEKIAFGGLVAPSSNPIVIVDAPPTVVCNATVPASNVTGLNTAVTNANTLGTPQTICLEAGTYTLTAAHNSPSDGANGLPVITGNITLYGLGNGATITRSSDAPSFRIAKVETGGRLVLHNITVRGGSIRNLGMLELVNSTMPDEDD